MSIQGTPGIPCVPLLIHLGTPEWGVLAIRSLLKWRRVKQAEIRKLLRLAYAGTLTGSSTHRLFNKNLSSEELRLGFSCPGVLTSKHSQMTRYCPGSQTSALPTLPTVCMITRAISVSPHPAPFTPRDLSPYHFSEILGTPPRMDNHL